jgi:hypothetical protein
LRNDFDKVNITYRVGPLLKESEVFLGISSNTHLTISLENFFNFILDGSLTKQMDDYSVPTFRIGSGKLVGTYTASDSLGKNVTMLLYKDSEFIMELVVAKTIQSPVYCRDFCGNYDSFLWNDNDIYYAVIPFPDCNRCSTSGPNPVFDSLTFACSNEL